ncbi:thioredoxin family protein [Staphylococcus pseudintermedius]|uniref:Thioredoxin n=1 Tax=Staphylococcus pseudintermedius TaxID=283734 RepID=A0A8H9BWM7_STAPS|nr:thioredoxin family protein [Staphylococcus pseudintermedius]EGQ0305568.1 thioredoxin family protein [Staphylococcus pseudintermedius]EGQ0319095.1 thioredoxin family protein [Staphylococcus pseudintermedius]EGQ0330886.1 thioredoxin family protein [Staphylococcus pseudintermedius]EGQ0359594.1 thioredoxin family protein [Staphylococcus pseudintermedius]EGQ0363610.1 thioredoxin family protein [Staphylococcus pseudintermedius]
MIQLESEQQFKDFANDNTVFLFSANWCGDCRVIEPGLPELEEKYAQFKFVKVDRDEFIDLAVEHDIMGIPSFLVYQNGQQVGSYIGKERKTIEQIDTFLSQF